MFKYNGLAKRPVVDSALFALTSLCNIFSILTARIEIYLDKRPEHFRDHN